MASDKYDSSGTKSKSVLCTRPGLAFLLASVIIFATVSGFIKGFRYADHASLLLSSHYSTR